MTGQASSGHIMMGGIDTSGSLLAYMVVAFIDHNSLVACGRNWDGFLVRIDLRGRSSARWNRSLPKKRLGLGEVALI